MPQLAAPIFQVRGQVVLKSDGSPAVGLIVRAFDKDLRREEPLGEAKTDEKGLYAIVYTAELFARAEKKSADLVLRAFAPSGELLATSEIMFNAPSVATVNLTIEPQPVPQLSEYEILLAALAPIMEDLPPAELTEEDITFITREANYPRILIETLAKGSRLAQQTAIPTEAFYAWGHYEVPLDLQVLLTFPIDRLIATLQRAIDANIVPASLSEAFDAIESRLRDLRYEQGVLIEAQFIGRLVDQATTQPIPGLLVRAYDLEDDGPQPRLIGTETSNAQGLFTVGFPTNARDGHRQLQLEIVDSKGQIIHQVAVQAEAAQTAVVDVPVSVPSIPAPPSPTIDELDKQLLLNLPGDLRTFLEQAGIQNLADIRRAGGLNQLQGLPNSPAVRELEAHATLSMVTTDLAVSKSLVDGGFRTIAGIASTPRTRIVALLGNQIGEFKAAQLHSKAQAQAHVLDNILTDARTNGEHSLLHATLPEELTQTQCHCRDCEAAVSPQAYLVDLLDYAVSYLEDATGAMTLSKLYQRFHQPFGGLPVICDEKEVCRVRLAIEVLRRHLAPESQTGAEAQAYLQRAYITLLSRIGTSYEALRLARSDTPANRSALAERLGIQLRSNRPDQLDELLLEPNAITEQALERIFGLVDTTRDGLSDGVTLGDDQRQILRWSLDGVAWRHNTDENGAIYLSLSRPANAIMRIVEAFSDQARTQLVARGSIALDQGLVSLLPENLSNLSGQVNLNYQADTQDITLIVMPQYLVWRLLNLRDQWHLQDWPVAAPADAPPLIDPDLIGPEDLRNPLSGDRAFDLWDARHEVLIARKAAVRAEREAAASASAGFETVLADVGLSLAARDAGQDITSQLEGLSLAVRDFDYLLRIERLISTATLLDSEWDEVYDIVVQVFKRQQFPTWRSEESQANLTLGPDYFRIPSPQHEFPPREPEPLPIWRASDSARRTWQRKLQSRIDQEQAAIESLQNIVRATEAEALPILREALVAVSGIDARSLSALLLIDFQADSCQWTTRTAQAIETIQQLLWSARTEQLTDGNADLRLEADDFDDAWKWLGSYATWRAAMMVFLYPENVLLPSLRRWQTPVFSKLIEDVRDRPRLTPEQACQMATSYASYFHDVCNLTPEGAVFARTEVRTGDCRNNASEGDQFRVFLFARATEKGAIYFSWYDVKDETGYAQSPWEHVPNFDNVLGFVGAAAYGPTPETRAVYVFACIGDSLQQKLVYNTYSLGGTGWSNEVFELGLPENATTFSAVVKQRNRENEPPHLAIRLPDGTIYGRYLNQDGTDWTDGDWGLPSVSRAKGANHRLYAMVEGDGDAHEFYLVTKSTSQQLYYRLFGPKDDGHWRLLGPQDRKEWLGSFPWPSTKHVYVFWRHPSRRGRAQYSSLISENSMNNTVEYRSFSAFDAWLMRVVGVSLASYIVPLAARNVSMTANETVLKYLTRTIRDQDNQPVYARRGIEVINALYAEINSQGSGWQDWKVADAMVQLFTSPRHTLEDVLTRLFSYRFTGYSMSGFFRETTDFKIRSRENRSLSKKEQSPPLEWGAGLERIVLASGEYPAPYDAQVAYKISPYDRSDPPETKMLLIDLPGGPDLFGVADQPTFLRDTYSQRQDLRLVGSAPIALAPFVREPFEITERLDSTELQVRRTQISKAFLDNQAAPAAVRIYLEEAWYFVPMYLALQLQRRGQYVAALDWLRTVYDYTVKVFPKIYYPLVQEQNLDFLFARSEDWLLDPLNPHVIAATRQSTYTRFTLLALVRCFLEYADAEFSRDTAESVALARTLYTTALNLLNTDELQQHTNECPELEIKVGEDISLLPEWQVSHDELEATFRRLPDARKASDLRDRLRAVLTAAGSARGRLAEARQIAAQALAEASLPESLASIARKGRVSSANIQAALLARPEVAQAVEQVGLATETRFLQAVSLVANVSPLILESGQLALPWLQTSLAASLTGKGGSQGAIRPNQIINRPPSRVANVGLTSPLAAAAITMAFYRWHIPAPSFSFCIPPNPIVSALRMQVELNLYKIRTCRNIAGDERLLEPYAATTSSMRDLPAIGGGQIVVPGTATLRPTPYRYVALIERAKQLVSMAQQIEAAFLSALEKRDAEFYNQLGARQGVALARAGVRLQDLRVREAEDGVTLAGLQRERALIQQSHFQGLLDEGLISSEIEATLFLIASAVFSNSAAATFGIQAVIDGIVATLTFGIFAKPGENAGQALSALASAASTNASLLQTFASYERREQEWRLQRDLARQDVRIGNQQIRIAQDQVRVTGQERTIAQMQADHAEETANFLATKFTNVELYDWMSNILEGVYSFFLQQAAAMAQLAASQLAFERQEAPPPFIQADYWEAPLGADAGTLSRENTPDRRGLTGSARLVQDIFQLDQYAFSTDRRKQQLTKTISLAQLAPSEFQRFRENGVMPFATPMTLFDQDFPGHYLRLIKRVRVSIIALIPPIAGIKATLSSSGLSRAIINANGIFEPTIVTRPPETISLTSPRDATGLFDLTSQSPELLLPFEGVGVDTAWELQLPKAANQFDYDTIADVLITIEYTALNNLDYRRQVISQLNRTFSADRPFSFRNQFADQWYDLNHPEQSTTPMVVEFSTERADFPPNLDQLIIEQVVFFFARKEGAAFEVTANLMFASQGGGNALGGSATSIDGIISTRRSNASAWVPFTGRSPFGMWQLDLTAKLSDGRTVTEAIQNEDIEDILFVITYSGQTPEWPA